MKKWNFYTSSEIKPEGWLKRQLTLQAESLNGNLDKVWRDVRDSAWIGGDAEGWERVPYWLDGFIPLAYLLENEDMITRAQKYMDAIIASQQPDGWICPCSKEQIPTYDTWAVQLISKVLTVYYECSKDPRVPRVLYNTLKNYHKLLSEGTIRLFDWGKARWFETFIAIEFLYRTYEEDWLLDLAGILKEQGTDYPSLTGRWKRPLNQWTYETHIVNLAMMLKYEAVSCAFLKQEYRDQAQALYDILYYYNGTPVELFTGDECLSGLSPIHGTELCAVAEQMYSYELLYANTGDPKWAERLEVVAFNALPATISDDMWTHQYVQQSNQINCIKFPGWPLFRTNNVDAHLFGLEPNYGCCTANFGQAWPKLALSAFMYQGDTVCNALAVPGKVETADYSISLETNYPFEHTFCYKVNAKKAFTLQIRIPSFAHKIQVEGKEYTIKDEMLVVAFGDNESTVFSLSYDTAPVLVPRPHDLYSVKYGSLVFSLPVDYKTVMYEYIHKQVERKFPYCDYEYVGTSKWNYGYSSTQFTPVFHGVHQIPFSSKHPALTLEAKVTEIPWGLAEGSETICAPVPHSCIPTSEEITTHLYPYGCAKLRMTELPLV